MAASTDKEFTQAAVQQIFDSSANHYMTIGVGLNVDVSDLMPIPGTASTNLNIVFQKWFQAKKNLNWDTLLKLCGDYPDKLGRAKFNLLEYLGSTESHGTRTKQETEKSDPKEPFDSAAAGKDKTKSDDQKPPNVSEFFPKLEDFESEEKMTKKYSAHLTEEEQQEFIGEVNVILVTATSIEYRAVMGATEPTGGDGKYIKVITKDGSTDFILGKYGRCNVAVIMTEQGPDSTQKVLSSVLDDVKAKYVIAIGICYGAKESKTEELGDKTKLADIIVAKSIVNTEYQRSEEKRNVLPDTYHCGEKLLNLFKHDKVFNFKDKPVKVHVGVLASEFTLHRNEEEKQKILKQVPQALGGEMEANGINRVANKEGFQWIVIKSIVDWGNEGKDKTWQPFGAVSCARFILKCLKDQPGEGDPLKKLL